MGSEWGGGAGAAGGSGMRDRGIYHIWPLSLMVLKGILCLNFNPTKSNVWMSDKFVLWQLGDEMMISPLLLIIIIILG